MESLTGWLAKLLPIVPLAVQIAAILAVLFAAHFILQRRRSLGRGRQLEHQLIMLVLSFLGVIAIVLALPLRDATKGQLLTLVGLLVTAAIALSSTTFVGNAMAGVMLRAVRNFHTGDFVRVGEHFGRVSERGLFHTEIQTEDRDLTTLPNLYLVSNPVTVMRSSGTILSAQVSLGYDLPRSEITRLLLEAGSEAGLAEPFVQVQHLGDFSVTYRLAGLLTEVKQVLSARSRLRALMMDHLHRGGVEIVSPTFMNTRTFRDDASFVPPDPESDRRQAAELEESAAEALAFDKAERAASLETLVRTAEELAGELKSLKERIKEAEAGAPREALERELKRLEARREGLARVIEEREAANKDQD